MCALHNARRMKNAHNAREGFAREASPLSDAAGSTDRHHVDGTT